jgi:PAS domain S-box-containing protein
LDVGNLNKKKWVSEQAVKDGIGSSEFPIVGVGASAGGLEAFRVLLEFLPVDTGLAFVIIQHLAAGQESMLTDILSRFTSMPVHQVEDGLKVEPDNVYVIPPGSTMTLSEGALRLNPKGKSLRPIDDFFRSLAAERKTQAIGIVLSGTGTDGTEGLKAVKAEGGITFAQKPDSAQYAGMPQNAISAEAVDFILSADKIAKELSKIAKNPHLVRSEIVSQESKITKEPGLRKIFSLLRTSFNVDFSHYKDTVVKRRVTRRIVINHIDNISDYADYLGTHHDELKALFDDMLIGVTSFFREPKTFETLKEKLFPELLKNRKSKEPLRVWIPGCSSGEEAYSFAIVIQEFLEENGPSDIQVQIFGTDVNEKNVDRARQGIYPKSIEAYVSENRLKRFFTNFNGSYQIAKFIRDKCMFAKQDLTADPPFSNLDLISCRNMLIYFDSQLQERIIPILHYALKPNGFLILGESESLSKFTNLFEPVHKKSFIYTKRIGQYHVNFGVNYGFSPSRSNTEKAPLKESLKKDASALLRDKVDRLLITEYVPAAMLVNSNLDILVFRGNVMPYLSPESGQSSLNVSRFLRKELRSEVQTLVYRAKKECRAVAEAAIRFQSGELEKTVNIQVIPLPDEASFFLVLFEDVSAAAAHLRKTIELTASPNGRENVKDSQIRELKEELDSSKQTLKTIVENQEATNEELRSAMEEVQSSNEELQSTNEELETAKEELQSSNEELTTLNDELKNRNQALAILSDNQANLNRNVDPAVVMIDGSLKIRLFTPSAQKILNLVPSDVGQRLSNVRLAISIHDLEKTILQVINSLGSEVREVTDEKGCFFELRIRPYVTEDNRIDGAVLSFIDVNELRQHENKLQIEETKYRTLAENSPDIIARFDRNLRYLYVNSVIEKITGISPKNFVGKTDAEVGLSQDTAEKWNKVLQNVIQSGKAENGELEFPTLEGPRIHQYVVVPEFSINEAVETVLALLKDITDPKKSMELARKTLERYRSFVEVSGEIGWIANDKGEVVEDIPSWRKFTGQSYEEVKGWGWSKALHPIDLEHALFVWKEAVKTKNEYSVEYRIRRHDGFYRLFEVHGTPIFKEDGSVLEWVGTCIDITERKKVEEDLRKQAALIDLSPDAIFVKDTEDIISFWSQGAEKLYGWTRNEALGQKVEDLLLPEFPESLESINRCLKETGRWCGEVVQRTKNGEIKIVQSWWLTKNYENGRMMEIFESNVDITERKKAEDKVRFEAERLSRVMENDHDMAMLTNAEGVILYVNSALKEVTGYGKEEFLNKSPWIIHPADSQNAKEIYKSVLKGKSVEFEHRIITKDGRVKWVIHSVAPIMKEDKVIEMVSTLKDITERKKSETEREIMVEFLRIANAPNKTIEFVKAAVDFFQKQSGCEAVGIRLKEGDEYPYYVTKGFPPEHVRLENQLCTRDDTGKLIRDSEGKPIIECMCGNVLSGRFDPRKNFFTEKGSFWTNSTTTLLATTNAESRGKTRNCCNHEGYESVALLLLAIGDTRLGLLQLNDKREGMFNLETIQMWERIADRLSLALSRTISEEALSNSEKQYKALSEHLEALVEERTKQLKDSERLAAIGTVAGMVGHDIRNPLQAITGDVFLAQSDVALMPDTDEKKSIQENLSEIERNALYISKIISDLQDFAKMPQPKIEETVLEQVIKSALANLDIPENIEATYDLEKDFLKIKADPTYLQRILINLFNNAIQAMPKGGKLTISAIAKNGKATISVQDTGEGIPESVKSKIFTPLMTTKAKGQGFGLASVKRFTEAMGGSVAFETESGKGTKFKVELPL